MLMFSSLPSSLLLFSLLIAVSSLPVESAAPELRQLTAGDFSTSTKHGVWFIEYFSPFCGHCRQFAPTWRRLVEHVESQTDPGISLAQVNCAIQGDLCNENNVKSYPSLRLYKEGESIEDYDGDRDFDLLSKYVAEHARAPLTLDLLPNPNGELVSLDKNTFHATIDQGPTFVKFFAPWCGHCKKLAPTWIKFAAQMKEKVTVAEVNCEDHASICSSEKVKGYPTIFYQHGHTLDYTGRRTLEALEAFADAALAPPLTTIVPSDLPYILDQQDVFYLFIYDKLDPVLRDSIEEASQILHGSPQIFSIQASPELLTSVSLPTTQVLPVLVSMKDHSMVAHRQLVVSTASPKEEVSDWLLKHALPTSAELSAENFQRIMGPSPAPKGSPNRLVVLGAIDLNNLAHIDIFKQTAQTWHRGEGAKGDGQIMFAWMDKEKWASWLKSVYGVTKGPEPAVVIVDHGHLLYYDLFPTGDHISLETSSILTAIEGVHSGVLRAKHSENLVERFARASICTFQYFIGTTHHIHPVAQRLGDSGSRRLY
ncbi:thioredoxin-like protein [Ramaria rubella]|nr:thioredoxin-like protein [Ramaria rubella]